jgi:hypothetical protein
LSVEDHAFNFAIRETFQEATDISDQRAMEYGDTWNVDRMRDGLLGLTLRLPQPPHLHKEFIRLVRCAVMVDVKDSRMDGPWKQDSLLDKLNYEAAFLQWHAAYVLAVLPFDDPEKPGAMGFPEEIELSDEGRQRFAEMTEKPPIPGAAERRIEKLEAELQHHGYSRTGGTTCPGCAECAG